MKTLKILILVLFASLSSFAQDPQLFKNDWYLQKVIIDGQDNFPPNLPTEPQIGKVAFIENEDVIEISYCDSTNPTINFDLTENIFNLEDNPIILIGLCSYQENLSFASKYFSVFYNQHIAINPFNYTITNENGIIILTIINSVGNKAIYTNELLANQNFDISSFTIFPNPVKNILQISTQIGLQVKQIQVYDVMGKKVLEAKSTPLDVSNLASGLFFVKLETTQGVLVKRVVRE